MNRHVLDPKSRGLPHRPPTRSEGDFHSYTCILLFLTASDRSRTCGIRVKGPLPFHLATDALFRFSILIGIRSESLSHLLRRFGISFLFSLHLFILLFFLLAAIEVERRDSSGILSHPFGVWDDNLSGMNRTLSPVELCCNIIGCSRLELLLAAYRRARPCGVRFRPDSSPLEEHPLSEQDSNLQPSD